MTAVHVRRDLLDRVSRWRDTAHLGEIFASGPGAAGLSTQIARADALLDVQDRVLARFGSLSLDPVHTVSFIHRDAVYLAPHFNWGSGLSVLSPAALAVFLATQAPDPAGAIEAVMAAGPALLLTGRNQENTCFTHTGFTYANTHDSFTVDAHDVIDLDNPSLLFLDHGGDLVGCGFFRSVHGSRSVFGRPLQELHDEWFLHVAGKHTDDGGFEPTEHGGARHHDEFWDIHIWFSRDDLGNPTGIPTVGWTMAPRHIATPPNVVHAASPGAVDHVICSNGRSSAGLYADPS